jgi:dynein heavy chain 1, cytosolic
MTLTSVLEAMPEFVLASLNFSSGTTPDLILKTFAQYCEIVDSPDGLIMQPNRQSYRESQWLVVFCDEINLPERDAYGTQTVIMFLRQLTEQNGFWNNDCKWISLRRIQFVGACNPPTDAGRVPLSERFLRHAPLLLVDYPAEGPLKQIYRCFVQALLKLHPNLRGYVDPLTDAMVEFYLRNQQRFTPDVAPQYIYSPRELSRWIRAMYEAMEPLEAITLEELVRLWAHEALRLFQDRLITQEEKAWCDENVDDVAARYFGGVDLSVCLARPMLYSNWLKKTYQSTDRDVLRDFVAARLRVFYEEELDVPLVIFDDVLEHVLRIDNVLRHPMGHLLLVGEAGVGKTVLSRFVSWMNGLAVFQIKGNNKYTIEQFDDDLRTLLRRVGVDGEKICFIFDENNALSSAFLERMNALLASGEVPGLFEGDERVQLMAACRESFSQRNGMMMDSEDELWRQFTKIVQRNLHVVFTMNPASADFDNRCTTSPALFNRCVVDWFGTWSPEALAQVGHEFTLQLDTGFTEFNCPSSMRADDPVASTLSMVLNVMKSAEPTLRDAVVAALVSMHRSAKAMTVKLGKVSGRQFYLSPR